mmetsp:Transcript_11362/g.31635  ORF Transcript_11362/g.31635 Transcript_11362/m.31635 type:complete len:241 (+) Transcript_11362:1406-2128(+)
MSAAASTSIGASEFASPVCLLQTSFSMMLAAISDSSGFVQDGFQCHESLTQNCKAYRNRLLMSCLLPRAGAGLPSPSSLSLTMGTKISTSLRFVASVPRSLSWRPLSRCCSASSTRGTNKSTGSPQVSTCSRIVSKFVVSKTSLSMDSAFLAKQASKSSAKDSLPDRSPTRPSSHWIQMEAWIVYLSECFHDCRVAFAVCASILWLMLAKCSRPRLASITSLSSCSKLLSVPSFRLSLCT